MSYQTFDPAPILDHYTNQTNQQIAAAIGVHPNTITAWRNGHTRIRANQADRIACHNLGTHPSLLWPNWWLPPRGQRR